MRRSYTAELGPVMTRPVVDTCCSATGHSAQEVSPNLEVSERESEEAVNLPKLFFALFAIANRYLTALLQTTIY